MTDDDEASVLRLGAAATAAVSSSHVPLIFPFVPSVPENANANTC